MMIVKQLTPNLMVENVRETVEYYQNILGFTLVMSVPQEGVLNWAMVQYGDVNLMFQEKNNMVAEYPILKDQNMGGGLTFYIKVTDVKGLYNKIHTQVQMVSNLHRTFYGAEEFAIQDRNGFVLTFAGEPRAEGKIEK